MSQKIGPREEQLRAMRATKMARPSREAVAAALPKPAGKKPVRRKAKREDDNRDAKIARGRLAGINQNPGRLVQGNQLRKRLARLQTPE